MIPVYRPYLPPHVLKYAHEALDSGWLSKGKYNVLTAEALQNLLKVKHVLLTSSGTTAGHLVACALKRHYKCSKIIMPNNVYIAAWNVYKYADIELCSVDADLETWNFHYGVLDRIIKSNPCAAIGVVHNLGNIVNVPKLKEKYPDKIIVEDACEGFLGEYSGKPVGTATLSSISFFGNKNITSGEGGAVLVGDDDLYEYLDCLHGQGQHPDDERFVHRMLGYNYRMTNVQAAILYGQLKYLSEIIERKSTVFDTYRKLLTETEVVLQKTDDDTKAANWMLGVRIPGAEYCDMEKFLSRRGIETRPMFCEISRHGHLNHPKLNFNNCNAKQLRQECIVLPSYCELSYENIKYVVSVINQYIHRLPHHV